MGRAAAAGRVMLVLALLHIRVHHAFHGPPVDYFGLGLAAFASWVLVPGPGESVLIAEAIFAARHDLDISSLIGVAWVGATVGGFTGWLVGLKAGRRLVTAAGPFHTARRRAVERGEVIFSRHPYLAIYLTPSWVAGIHGVGRSMFIAVTAASAAVWAAAIGLGAYFAGPPIVDLVGDMGKVTAVALGVLVVGSLAGEFIRRRRRAGHEEHAAAAPDEPAP